MDKERKKIENEFLKKQKILENAKTILKTEFIGIDNIIDEVIDNVSSWFFLSDIQEKPIVINLWGLTGVGKTSLVNRLVELIDFKNLYYRFDLGEKEGSFSFSNSLDELCENNDSSPIIIALDEIQHSRTVSGPFRTEVDDKNRMLWELIDSGKIQYVEWKRGLWAFEDLLSKLRYIVFAGVKVENGEVIKKKKLYCKEMELDFEDFEYQKIMFIPDDNYDDIIEYAGETLNLHLRQDVENLLKTFDEIESIEFLDKVFKIAKQPSIKNFSKALIFVLGNIDEAYTMSNNFSSDIDADEFNKLSKKITVPQIKKALQSRFRNEQIARLGNIHIIYPALDRKSYKKIIDNELKKYATNLKNKFNVNIEFDDSVKQVIYNEGVYPTQGVRPIYTSIHQIIKSKISVFLSEIYLKSIKVELLSFSIDYNKLICLYLKNDKKVFSKSVEVITTLGDMRKNKKDDTQAITAVHESGHVVLSSVLLKTIPQVVYSVTPDVDSNGFIYSSFAWKYVSRKEIIPRTAMMLGGYIAEEIIFGKENVTTGAETDIEKATEFLSQMYKYSGMGKTPINYNIPIAEKENSYHKIEDVENEIKNAIEEAKYLAEQTLKEHKPLLLRLANYLSDNRMLKKDEIRSFINKNTVLDFEFVENGDHLFYRKRLKQLVKDIDPYMPNIPHFNNVISLNNNVK